MYICNMHAKKLLTCVIEACVFIPNLSVCGCLTQRRSEEERHHVCALSTVLTAGLWRRLVPPRVIELPVLLLREAEPLLLHLVDLLLGAERVAGHGQVVPQHGLLLSLPLGPRVLQLGALWRERRWRGRKWVDEEEDFDLAGFK